MKGVEIYNNINTCFWTKCMEMCVQLVRKFTKIIVSKRCGEGKGVAVMSS
jgi:hypothetical protein